MRVKGLVLGNPDALSSLRPVCYRLSVRCSGGMCILTLLTSTASAGTGVSPLRVHALGSLSGSGVSSPGPGAGVPLWVRALGSPLPVQALGSLSGSGVWGLGSPSPGAGVSLSGSGLWGSLSLSGSRRWGHSGPLLVLTASALHRGSPRGGCGRGTGQTLTALEMLPNQHAFSPPFENKNGAFMDRWEEGRRSQLRQAGRRVAGEGFPEGTGWGAGPGGI